MYISKNKKVVIAKEFSLITLGVLLEAIAIYFFLFPNNFCFGGTAGISVILSAYFPTISPSLFVTALNIILLVIAFFILGKGTGLRTTYASLLFSFITMMFQHFIPLSTPLTSNPLLELIYAIGIFSCGTAVLLNNSASSGGTDILAMIMKKYTSMNIGKAFFITNILVVLIAAITFGMELGLLCILGFVIRNFVIDLVIESINSHKYFNIVTTKADIICDFIIHELKSGATIADAKGAFTLEGKKIIFAVVTPSQAIGLRQFVRMHDPNSMILITNTSQIIGGGFRSTL